MAKTLLALAALLAVAAAGPITYFEPTTQCALSCPSDADSAFVPGQSYSYNYASSVVTSIPGATEQASQMYMTATATVEVLDRCELALTLSGVSLEDVDPTTPDSRTPVPQVEEFRTALQAHPLRFALYSGRVEGLCPMETEETWVLNVKRAIISGLQMTAPKDLTEAATVQETDVVGECEATYHPVSTSWSTTTVRKTKDLLACTGRQDTDSIIQSISYSAQSRLQSLPLLKSTYECSQDVNAEGRVVIASCTENHIFRPFSREESGAKSAVTFSLTFASQSAAVSVQKESITRRETMLLEHVSKPEEMTTARRATMSLLRNMCATTEAGITTETPAEFLQLVKEMKRLDTATLMEVANSANTDRPCPRANKFFRDALPTVATEAAISVMQSMIVDGSVTGAEADLWMASLTFINAPTRQMLADAKPLLEMSEPLEQAVLAVSSMVHSYCKTDMECASATEVTDIITILKNMLGSDCSAEHSKVLLALKALGNTGRVETAVTTLTQCFQNADLPMSLRVAAVNAFRRANCAAETESLRRLMEDTTSDSELRINAYLMLMQCPDYSLIQAVTTLLEQEQVNQVGSFIWTHLTNLAETSCPFKQEIRRILSNVNLQTSFDLDKRKFSRNMEWSAYSELLNAGSIVDSNWIWSPQSFVPRSGSMNLTVDLFGQSVNLMEVGGRVEGLDSVLEKFFGPDAAENVETPSEIQTMDQKFRRTSPEPQGSYFFRMFGHEMNFAEFKGLNMEEMMSKFNFLQFMIDLAKEHDIEMTKSMVVLDSDLCVPTIAGFPLTLSVDGTVVTDLKLKGRMDLRNIGSSPRTMAIVGTVRPSAALKINGQMGVDAWFAKTGLKMVNTLHTSTLADGSIELQNGGIFNVDINMPEENMDVFSAESKFYVTYRDTEAEQMMITEGRFEAEECTGSLLETALGLQMCAQVSVPQVTAPGAPWLPFTGPASTSLRLSKRDTFSKYHMEARMQMEQVAPGVNNRLMAISFNTPGSQIDRELTIRFDLNEAEKSLNVDLRSPWKKFEFTSALEMTEEMNRVTGSFSIDDARTYGILAELGMSGNEVRNVYTPRIQVTLPEQDPYTFTSEILYRPGKRAQIEMSLENVFQSPVTLNGELTRIAKNKQLRYEGDLSVRAPLGKAQLIGSVDHTWTREEVNTNFHLETKYKPTGGKQQTLGLNTQMHFTNQEEATQLSLTGSTTTTVWPEYDMDYSVLASKDASTVEFSFNSGLTNDKPTRISVTTHANHDLTGPTKAITASMGFQAPFLNIDYNGKIQFNATHDFTGPTKAITASLGVQAPFLNMDYTGKLQHSHSADFLSTILTIGEETKAEIRLHRNSEGPMNMSAEVTFLLPGRHMAYSQSLQQKEGNEYHTNLTVGLDHYTQLSFVSMYRMSSSHDLTITMTSPFTPTVVLEGSVVPNLLNMEASGRIAFDGEEYALMTSWNKRIGINGNANLELAMPQRKITWEGQLSHHENTIANSMTFKWDADMDATKKLVTEFALDTSTSGPSMTIDAQWWPNKFVSFTTALTSDERTFWHATRSLSGSARFTSSFVGFEELAAAFSHDRTETTTTTHGEATWVDTIAFDYVLNKHNGWSNVDKTFTLTTPWAMANTLVLENSYNKQPESFVSNSKIQWGEEMITLSTSASGQSVNSFEGDLKITTPFTAFESVTFGINHSFDNGVLDSNVQCLLGSDTYSFTIQMTHAAENADISNRGTITVVLPLYNSPNTLVWEHTNNQKTVNTHIEFSAEGQRSTLDVSAKLRRRATLTVRLSTPYIKDVSFEFNHDAEKASLRKSTTIEASYGAQSIQLSNQFNFEMGQIMFLETRFTSPFTSMIQLTIDDKFEDGQYIMNNEFRWGENTDKVSLTGTFSYELPAYEVSVNVFTPWTDAVAFTSANTNTEGLIWQTTANVMHKGTSVARLTTTESVEPKRMLTVEVHTISQYMENFLFDIEVEGELRVGSGKLRIEHNMLPSPVAVDMTFNIAELTNLMMEFNFEAPIENWNTIHFLAKQVTTDGHWKSDLSFETPMKKIVYSDEFAFASFFSWTSDTTLTIDDSSVYQLEGSMTNTDGYTIHFVWRMPDTTDKTFDFRHEGSMTNFRTTAQYTHEADKAFASVVEFGMTADTYQGAWTITTPVEGWTRSHIGFEHKQTTDSFVNNARVEVYGETFTADSTVSYGASVSAEAGVSTTMMGGQTLRFTLAHEGSLMNFRDSLKMVHNGVTYMTTAAFQPTNGEITLTIPQVTFRAHFEHSGTMFDWTNNAGVIVNENTYSARHEFKFTETIENTEFHVLSRFNIPEEILLEINHNGNILDFTNTMTARYYGQSVTGTSAFSVTTERMQLTASVETPFESYRNIRVEVSSDGLLDENNSNFDLSINDQHIIGQFTLQFVDPARNIAVSGELRTPFLDTIRFSTTHNGPVTDFTNSLSMSLGESAVSTDVAFKFVGELIEGTFSLRTPVETLNTMTIHFTHNGPITNFRNSVTATLNGQTISASSSNEYTATRKAGSISITTPFSAVNNLAFNYNHNGQMSNFNNEVSASVNGQVISTSTSFNMENNIEATFQLTTPFEAASTLRLSLSHEGSLMQFTNGLTAVFNTHTIRTETTFSMTESRINGMFSLMTPLSEAATFSASFNHEILAAGFNNEVMATLNGDEWRVNSGFNGENGNLRISTPGHNFESTFTHSGSLNNFENQMMINADNFVINANSRFVYTATSLEALIAFSLPEYTFEVSTTNTGNTDEFTNELIIKFNGDMTTLQNSFTSRSGHVEGAFSVSRNTDFSTAVSYRHTGSWDNFDNEITVTYNEQSGSMTNTFRYAEFSYKEFELVSNLRTPFTGYETMGMQFNHAGLWSNTQNTFTASLNDNTVAVSHVFKWLENQMEGSFGIISNDIELFSVAFNHEGPFTSMTNGFTVAYASNKVAMNHAFSWTENLIEETLSISYKDQEVFASGFRHEGPMNNFNNVLTVKVNEQITTMTNRFRFENAELELSSELTTPFAICDRLLFSIVHQGPMSNFNNQVTFTWNEWVFASTSQFAISGQQITMSYGFTTPFERLSAFNIAGSHTGDWHDCTSQMTVSLNGKSLEANSRFRWTDEAIEGSLTMSQMHMSFHHNMADEAFDNNFSISFNGEQAAASSSVRRSRRGISADAQISTPFDGYKTMAVSASSDESNYIFQIRRDDEELSLQTSVSSSANNHQASFTLTTPFASARQISGNFAHDGPLSSFHQEGSITIDGYKLGYDVEFTHTSNSMSGKLGLDSPFFDHFEIGTTLTGTITNFNENSYIMVQGQKYSCIVEFRMTENMHFKIAFMTPEEYSLTFSQAGPINAFTSEMIVNVAGTTYTNSVTFRQEGSTVDCTIATQMPGQMQLRFNTEGDMSNLRQTLEITIAGVTRTQNIEFTTDGRHISGRFGLNNLSELVKTFSIEFNNQGRMSNFQNMARVEVNGVSYEVSSNYRYTQAKVQAGISFKLPQEYAINIVQKGEASDMTLMIKTIIADEPTVNDFAFKNNAEGPFEMTWNMRTPYKGFRNFAIEYTLNTNGIFATSGLIRTPFELLDNIAFELRHEGGMDRFHSTGRITTPWTWMTEGTFEFNHQGSLANFQSGGNVVVNGNRFGAVANFGHSAEATTGSISLESPYFESMTAEFAFGGNMQTEYDATVTLQMNSQEIMTSLRYATTPKKTITYTLRTPWAAVQEMTLTSNFEGSLASFSTETTFVLNGERAVNTIHFVAGPTFQLSTTLTTPFTQLQEFTASVNHEGSMNNFNCRMNLGLNGQQMEGSLAFTNTESIKIATTLRTPFSEIQEFTANFNHQGAMNDFTTSADATLNGQTVRSNVSFRKAGNSLQTTSETVIPGYPTMGHNINFEGSMENFRLQMSINMPCEEWNTFGLTYNHQGTTAKFECSFELTTPFTGFEMITGTISHNGELTDFTNNFSLKCQEQMIQVASNFRFASTELIGSFEITSTNPAVQSFRASFENRVESNAGNGQTVIALNGETLYDMDYNLDLSSSKRATVTFRQPMDLTVTAATNYDANVMGLEFSINYEKTPYTIEAAVENNVFTFVCNTPSKNYHLTASFDLTETAITNDVTFRWSANPEDHITMSTEMTRNVRGQQIMYDGSITLNAKAYSFRTTLSHTITPGRHYITEMNIQGLVLRSDLVLRQPNMREFTMTVTAQHPSFVKDVVCTIEARIEPELPHFDGRFTLVFADQTFELQGRIADESQNNQQRYVAEASVSHPASALDVQFSSQLTNTDESMGGNMEVSYMMTQDRQKKNAALLAEINKLREEIKIQVQEEENPLMSMSGRRTVSNAETGHHHFTVTGMMAEREMLAEIDMDKSSPSFDLSFTLEPEQEFHMYGKYIDPSSMMIEAYREIQGSRVQDTQMSLRLSDSNVLNARAFFRPHIIDDLKALFSVNSGMGEMTAEIVEAMTVEISQKMSLLQTSFEPLHSSVTDLETYLTSTYERMYNNNDFYLREIADVINEYVRISNERWEVIRQQYADHFERKMAEISMYMEEFNTLVMEAMEVLSAHMDQVHAEMANQYNIHAKKVHDAALEWANNVRTHPKVQEMINTISTMEPAEYFIPLRETYDYHVQRLLATWEEMMSGNQALTTVKSWIEAALQNVHSIYEYLEFDETVQGWLDDARNMDTEVAFRRVLSWIKQQLDSVSIDVVTFEPSMGEFEVRITMPFQMKDLRSLPQIEIPDYFTQVGELYEEHMPTLNLPDYSLWDTYYNYKPASDPNMWVPPFNAHATIMGNQHFMTFDKKFYEFAGDECSFLLARDFIDGKFSVVLNYEDGQRRSLNVHSDNKNIEIASNLRVTVDGAATELPFVTTHTTVRRIADSIRVDNDHGITVTCELPHNMCTVNVSGWYYGKTGGLLGTYDNEPSNDFMTVERVPASSVEDFAASWSIGRQCSANSAVVAPSLNEEQYQACARLFEDRSSPMRPCFSQVNATAFMTMCMNDAAFGDAETAACDTAKFFVNECSRNGVDIRVPTECVKCELEGETLPEGGNFAFLGEVIPKQADVVFVVSHADCNEEVIARVGAVAEQIERNFDNAGIDSVNFGLVGFGGSGFLSQPHSMTIDSELMGNKDALIAALAGFTTVPYSEDDAFSAVNFAALYPFRPLASKSIIVIPCGACHEDVTAYSTLASALDARGITMHTLLQHDFRLQTPTPKTSFIFGVDRDGLFTPKHVGDEELIGDAVMRQQVELPKDQCATMADNTDGVTFDINKLVHSRPGMQKRFLDVLSRMIVKKTTDRTCMNCECIVENGVASTVCKSCDDNNTLTWLSGVLPVNF